MLSAIWRKAPQPVPEEARTRPAPIATTQKETQLLKESSAEKRRDRGILPTSPAFLGKEKEFAEKLAAGTPAAGVVVPLSEPLARPSAPLATVVDDAPFTAYEKKLLYPAKRSIDPLLFSIQAGETERFRALCAGRFKEKEIRTETKLAMLWFGLPIEPLPYNDFQGTSSLGDRLFDLGDDLPAKSINEPLKFLNSYDDRTYEFDEFRGGKWSLFHPNPRVSYTLSC